jgi:hypothetical protein
MATQTSYDLHPAIGFPGQIANPSQFQNVDSAFVEPSAGLAPGLAVIRGTADNQAAALTSGGEILGVTVARAARETADFAENEVVGVMTKGRIYVEVENAVSAGAQAYARHDSSGAGGNTVGAFRSDADTASARLFPGVFVTSTSGAGIAVLEVDVTGMTYPV